MADPRSPEPARDETHDFVRELARDLAPVERIPRLRTAAAAVLALWAVVAVSLVAWKGGVPALWSADRLTSGAGAILLGLCLAGVGGVVAALAAAVPGRGALARTGSALLGAGLLVAAGLGALLLRDDPSAVLASSLASDAACLSLGLVVAALPALGALLYVARAAPARPVAALVGVGVGCVGCGGRCHRDAWRFGIQKGWNDGRPASARSVGKPCD